MRLCSRTPLTASQADVSCVCVQCACHANVHVGYEGLCVSFYYECPCFVQPFLRLVLQLHILALFPEVWSPLSVNVPGFRELKHYVLQKQTHVEKNSERGTRKNCANPFARSLCTPRRLPLLSAIPVPVLFHFYRFALSASSSWRTIHGRYGRSAGLAASGRTQATDTI